MLARLLAVAMILPTGALAQNSSGNFYSGNELHEECQTNRHFVRGYVSAVFDSRYLFTSMGVLNEFWEMCAPESGTIGQLVDVVCKHVDETPETRHYSASQVTSSALLKAFPCTD